MTFFNYSTASLPSRRWFIRLVPLCAIPAAVLAQRRQVHGFVRDFDGRALKAAGVKLKDLRTLQIRSALTDGDGLYQFSELNPDVDYQLQAVFGDRSSDPKIIDRFASAPEVQADLRIDLRPGKR